MRQMIDIELPARVRIKRPGEEDLIGQATAQGFDAERGNWIQVVTDGGTGIIVAEQTRHPFAVEIEPEPEP